MRFLQSFLSHWGRKNQTRTVPRHSRNGFRSKELCLSGVLALLFLTVGAARSWADLFSLTDTTAEDWGYTAGGDLLALNHFDTGGRTVLINQISVAWNSLSSLARPTLALYSDPDRDGAPNDMQPLGIFPVIVQPGIVILNQTFQDYPIPPTLVSGSFFVAAFVSDRNSGNPCVIGVDLSSPHPGQSWIVENSNGPGLMNLQNPIGTSTLVTGLSRFVNGNHMIQAEYSVVPEPHGSLMFVFGLLALAAHRCNRTCIAWAAR